MQTKGLKIVLSGPSGSGKGTIVRELIKKEQFVLSISATTRGPRIGEENGVHYFFKTKEEFEKMIDNNALLEYASFCDNYYGTPKAFIEETIEQGKDILLEIEVQGAMQIKKIYPEAIFVFIIPPNLEELEKRLKGRNTETLEVIQKRLERAKQELKLYHAYDYVIVNESVEKSAEAIEYIVGAEKLKSRQYNHYIENMLNS